MGSELISFQSWGEEDTNKKIQFKSSSGRISILSSDFNYQDVLNPNMDLNHAHISIHLKENQIKILMGIFTEWLNKNIAHDLPTADSHMTEDEAKEKIIKQFYTQEVDNNED